MSLKGTSQHYLLGLLGVSYRWAFNFEFPPPRVSFIQQR